MTQRIVSEELLHNIQDAVIRLKPFVSGLGKAVLREIEIDVVSALEQPAVEPPSDLKAKWLGCALFDCIKASRIIRDDINELSVAELLHFAQDLKGQLERTAPQALQDELVRLFTPLTDGPVHQHKWFKTGAMEPGEWRCIDCGEWGKENQHGITGESK